PVTRQPPAKAIAPDTRFNPKAPPELLAPNRTTLGLPDRLSVVGLDRTRNAQNRAALLTVPKLMVDDRYSVLISDRPGIIIEAAIFSLRPVGQISLNVYLGCPRHR